jgi:hypothetical protein
LPPEEEAAAAEVVGAAVEVVAEGEVAAAQGPSPELSSAGRTPGRHHG